MARRGRGEGSIRRRPDGRWEATITLGGKRRSFYGKTRAEAKEKLLTVQRDHEQGRLIGDPRQSIETYLTDWLEAHRPPELRAATWRGYASTLRVHVLPVIGKVKLLQLTPQQVQQAVTKAQARGLSASTVAKVYLILHSALHDAVRLGLLAQNPCDRLIPPKIPKKEMRPLARDEAQRFLSAAREHWLSPLFALAISTGMREGELMALKWRDVDLEAGRLSVVASLHWRDGAPIYTQPKTQRSRRQIALAPEMVTQLRQHRHQQRLQRVSAGQAWQGDHYDAVFANELGFPLTAERIRRQFYAVLAQAGLPRIRFHNLRHTCATLLLSQGVNPKVVSEMLGHSTVAITLDIYSHVLPHMQQEAAQALSTALGW